MVAMLKVSLEHGSGSSTANDRVDGTMTRSAEL
jgi:hypothetical protein